MNAALAGIEAAAPAIGMVAAFACLIGGGALIARGGDRRKGILLVVMAAVLVFNVAMWTL